MHDQHWKDREQTLKLLDMADRLMAPLSGDPDLHPQPKEIAKLRKKVKAIK